MAITTRVDLERFEQEGYLVVEDMLDPAVDLDPVVAEYSALLDELSARWHQEGKLSSTYADVPFGRRLACVLSEMGMSYYQYFDIQLPFKGITEDTPLHLGPSTFSLLTSPRLLDVVEQFIGPEILSNPIQHVRIKPPESLLPNSSEFHSSLIGKTDWHQDQGVALAEVDKTNLLTVWIPVTDATVENGCLCVIPRSHQTGLVTHCSGTIPETLRPGEPTPVPIKRGGVLFLNRTTMHASLRNLSDSIRWSFDLRYNPIGQPTGRPAFPGFIARSRKNPESVVTDWRVWANLWYETRARLSTNDPGSFRRWTGQEDACA